MNPRVYIYTAKLTLMRLAAYPSRFFTLFLVDLVVLLAFFFLWSSLYQYDTERIINGYTLTAMLTYYAVTRIIRTLTTSARVARDISNDVRLGNLSMFLMKNINYGLYNFVHNTTNRGFRVVGTLVLLLVLTITFPNLFEKPQMFILFLFSMSFAVILNFFVFATFGCISFWTIKNWGLISIFRRTNEVLNGSLIPLIFFPAAVVTLSKFLPFQYMHYVPVQIYLGQYSTTEALTNMMIQIIWIIVIAILYHFVWKRGLKRYGAVGN